MKDIDVQAIWEKYALLEGAPKCVGYRIKCEEDDPNMFEPGRLKYCKRCRARQEQDRRAIRKTNPPPPPGPCPGCTKHTVDWELEHDHEEGPEGFRGYLCRKCNLALANANDDPSTLERLANHLRRKR